MTPHHVEIIHDIVARDLGGAPWRVVGVNDELVYDCSFPSLLAAVHFCEREFLAYKFNNTTFRANRFQPSRSGTESSNDMPDNPNTTERIDVKRILDFADDVYEVNTLATDITVTRNAHNGYRDRLDEINDALYVAYSSIGSIDSLGELMTERTQVIDNMQALQREQEQYVALYSQACQRLQNRLNDAIAPYRLMLDQAPSLTLRLGIDGYPS